MTRFDHSAGGIIYKKTAQGILILVIRDSHNNWSFPKGGIEKNETPLQAAQREIREEVGLSNVKPIRSLGRVDFWFKDKWKNPGQKVKKFVEYFLFENTIEEPVQANHDEGILEASWLPPDQASDQLTYKNLKTIIDRAIESVND
ncbi:NUDIX domain-containing protein [Candidatus Berkelbacteria bacterium]|nr:NUDIX domain-containing protein [Candidatus Berkelbacteria bacterium]